MHELHFRDHSVSLAKSPRSRLSKLQRYSSKISSLTRDCLEFAMNAVDADDLVNQQRFPYSEKTKP